MTTEMKTICAIMLGTLKDQFGDKGPIAAWETQAEQLREAFHNSRLICDQIMDGKFKLDAQDMNTLGMVTRADIEALETALDQLEDSR